MPFLETPSFLPTHTRITKATNLCIGSGRNLCPHRRKTPQAVPTPHGHQKLFPTPAFSSESATHPFIAATLLLFPRVGEIPMRPRAGGKVWSMHKHRRCPLIRSNQQNKGRFLTKATANLLQEQHFISEEHQSAMTHRPAKGARLPPGSTFHGNGTTQ